MIAIIVIIVKYNSNNSDSSNSKTSSVLCQDKVDPYKPSATLKPSACLHCLGPNQGSPRIFLETPALQPFLQIHRNPATKRQSQQQQHHHHQLLLLQQQQQQKLKNAEKNGFQSLLLDPRHSMTSPIICSPRFSVTAGFAPPSGLTPTKLLNLWESLQVNHQPSIGMINFSNSWDQKPSIFPFSGLVHFDTHPHENTRVTRGSF